MIEKQSKIISSYYEECFRRYGDTPLGFGWPNHADTVTRYDVMLDIVDRQRQLSLRPSFPSLLDFGCGSGAMLERVKSRGMMVNYRGVDVNPDVIATARQQHPQENFLCLDITREHEQLPNADFIIANGVFTVKDALSEAEMLEFFQGLVTLLFSKCNRGLAFNVMSRSTVDFERDDLFYQSFDEVAAFIKGLSNSFSFRNDYGLYEFTTYVNRV